MRRIVLAFALILAAPPAFAQQVMGGLGAPASSTGREGQFFLNANNGAIYGPKTGGTWGSPATTFATWLAAQTSFTVPTNLSVAANVPAASTCGTSPAVTAGSSSNAGQFTLGTGTPTACTITFATAFSTAAFCTVTPASAGGAAISGGYYLSAQSKTAFTLTIGTGTDSLVFNYTCIGN